MIIIVSAFLLHIEKNVENVKKNEKKNFSILKHLSKFEIQTINVQTVQNVLHYTSLQTSTRKSDENFEIFKTSKEYLKVLKHLFPPKEFE